MRRWLCEVQHSYFVIRKVAFWSRLPACSLCPQTVVLFVIRKLLSISHGFTKYELRNQWRRKGGAYELRITKPMDENSKNRYFTGKKTIQGFV